MTIDTNDMLNSILESFSRIDHIKSEDIPNIELYMDQITTFMDAQLQASKRYPDDKILTKTMINNYTKSSLLPPPEKKKYSKEHILLLIFIYYFKSILSIKDIQMLLDPIVDKYFKGKEKLDLEGIYNEVFSMEKEQVEHLKEDIILKYKLSQTTFSESNDKEKEFLHLFSFICLLSFDVYLKKQLIETLLDQLPENGK
ncbi:MAG TPA: DUF1836 domain-containing protein [Candidatus Merdenecus merdavium]|nr:DUF1836 domain-containing protein [Candidatus Merdenecus merdavium]